MEGSDRIEFLSLEFLSQIISFLAEAINKGR